MHGKDVSVVNHLQMKYPQIKRNFFPKIYLIVQPELYVMIVPIQIWLKAKIINFFIADFSTSY